MDTPPDRQGTNVVRFIIADGYGTPGTCNAFRGWMVNRTRNPGPLDLLIPSCNAMNTLCSINQMLATCCSEQTVVVRCEIPGCWRRRRRGIVDREREQRNLTGVLPCQ